MLSSISDMLRVRQRANDLAASAQPVASTCASRSVHAAALRGTQEQSGAFDVAGEVPVLDGRHHDDVHVGTEHRSEVVLKAEERVGLGATGPSDPRCTGAKDHGAMRSRSPSARTTF